MTLPMASPLKKLISSFILILSYLIVVHTSEPPCRRYKSLISFGDSSSDTGNFLLHLSDVNHLPQAAFLPYGETFFHPPSGRYSDGRLIIDFIAEFLGVPYVPPYFGSKNLSFEQGINFAVYGATTLDRKFLIEQGIESDFTNVSLSVHLSIFKQILPNLCASSFSGMKLNLVLFYIYDESSSLLKGLGLRLQKDAWRLNDTHGRDWS